MKRFFVNLTVASVASLLGIAAANIPYHSGSRVREAGVLTQRAHAVPPPGLSRPEVEPRGLRPEEAQVIAEAEYFVCWNGYTHQGCGGAGRIYFEPGENSNNLDQIWGRRRDTLEGRAYGLSREEKGNSTFWTVVFRYTERAGKRREKYGRAYVVKDDRGPFARRYFVSFHRDSQLEKVGKML